MNTQESNLPYVCADCGHYQTDMLYPCENCKSTRVIMTSIVEEVFGKDWRSQFKPETGLTSSVEDILLSYGGKTINTNPLHFTTEYVTDSNHFPDYCIKQSQQVVHDQEEWSDAWYVKCAHLGNNIRIAVYTPEHTGDRLYDLVTDYKVFYGRYATDGLRIEFDEPRLGRVVITKID